MLRGYIAAVILYGLVALFVGSFALELYRRYQCYKHGHEIEGQFAMSCERCNYTKTGLPSPLLVIAILIGATLYAEYMSFRDWLHSVTQETF